MTATARAARFLFAGGGTGGHLYPAVAIADQLSRTLGAQRPVEILFVGTRRGLEYRKRDSLGYPLHLINVRGLARRLTLSNLLVPFVLLGALISCCRLLRRFDPDVVVGTGGYVAFPVLKVAAWKKIITVLQEQNSFPGVTTRKLVRRAQRVYLGFERAAEYLTTEGEIMVTGNPVRPNIASGDRNEAARAFGLDPNKKTILVMGGSQGARAVNQAVLRSLRQSELGADYQLLWQTGERDYTDVSGEVGEKAGHALFPFATDMAAVYAAADLAVARAGAISLAELEACRLPALLIPYPHAAGDHQRKNADECAKRGYATVVDEKDLSGIDILRTAQKLLASGQADDMRERLRHDLAGRRSAADVIAEDIIGLLHEKERQEAAVD